MDNGANTVPSHVQKNGVWFVSLCMFMNGARTMIDGGKADCANDNKKKVKKVLKGHISIQVFKNI
jgi:hypothetical protein